MSGEPTEAYPKIDASPTKQFFISMLVRDIDLLDAIVDLVDNSVDAARVLRPKERATGTSLRYEGLIVNLTLNSDEFKIRDNCGGIAAELARDYVFNFGRKADFPAVEGSVGEFGVGMKRALFKLGSDFSVESRSQNSFFQMGVDVQTWSQDPAMPWEFEFHEYQVGLSDQGESDRFAEVSVGSLNPVVSEAFQLGHVESELARMLGEQHQASLEHGLEILINGNTVFRRSAALLVSGAVQPLRRSFQLESQTGVVVEAEVLAGLAEKGESSAAGWYLFCNDRLVLIADKTELTGWGRNEGESVALYHSQHRQFRGYAFLNAGDVGALPWNTTKTSVDPTDPVYRRLLSEMILAMQQVLGVIREADTELDTHPRGAGPIAKAIKSAVAVPLVSVSANDTFTIKVARVPKAKKTVSIQYKVDPEELEAVKESISVETASGVGLATFEYYLESEVE